PWIGLTSGPFRLGHNPPFPAPALACSPVEVLEAACRLAGLLALLLRRGEFGFDLGVEARVLGQAEQEIDAIVLAPSHQRLAGKARIGAQQNAHLGPAPADLGDDPRYLLDAASAGIKPAPAKAGVRRTQFGDQEGVVIAVEETSLL